IVPVNPASFAVPVRQSSVAPVVPSTNGFLLKFGGSTPVAQGTYLLEHGSLGQFALFIVPAGTGIYTAVVNRLNAPTIIAIPFATGSGIGNQFPDLSGNLGVQKSVLRD